MHKKETIIAIIVIAIIVLVLTFCIKVKVLVATTILKYTSSMLEKQMLFLFQKMININ